MIGSNEHSKPKGSSMTSAGRYLSVAAALFLGSLSSMLLAPPAAGQANVQGQWQTLVTQAPINPVHIALMHNGKILDVSGSGNDKTVTFFQAGVFNPATDTMTTQPLPRDLFSTHTTCLP